MGRGLVKAPTAVWASDSSHPLQAFGNRDNREPFRFRAKREQLERLYQSPRPESGLDCLICAIFARERIRDD